MSGFDAAKLAEKAKDLYDKLYHLESEKYDLEERFKRQQYDMMELAERARQMNKGGYVHTKLSHPYLSSDLFQDFFRVSCNKADGYQLHIQKAFEGFNKPPPVRIKLFIFLLRIVNFL